MKQFIEWQQLTPEGYRSEEYIKDKINYTQSFLQYPRRCMFMQLNGQSCGAKGQWDLVEKDTNRDRTLYTPYCQAHYEEVDSQKAAV